MKVLFFQYGDFGEAYRRFEQGQLETYRDQKSSVDFVSGLAGSHTVATIAICDRSYEEELKPGLVAMGVPLDVAYDGAAMAAVLDRVAPDAIVCRTPSLPVSSWAARRRLPILPLFADIFLNNGARALLRNIRLRRALGKARAPCIANHSLNASRSVSRALWWPADRVVPWDWSRMQVDAQPKSFPSHPDRPTALFCGALSEPKGLGDCLHAVRILERRGLALKLTVAGGGDIEQWRSRASQLGVERQVEFAGLVSHSEVRKLMRRHDMVLVPSRHDYAEGLPNTIYEALAARSPLIMSDHPAFRGRLADGEEALVFGAADPSSLAASIERLLADPDLYQRLSERSEAAHDSLYIGMEFKELVLEFLRDPHDRTGWVKRHSLAVLPARP